MRYVPLGPINRVDGTNNMVVPYKSGYCGWSVPSTTDNPEEVVKFADWMAGPEGKLLYFYGLEGKHYDLVDGFPVVKPEILKLKQENPEKAKLEGFRGVRAFWGEHLCYTDMDNLGQFGELAWGEGRSANETEKTVAQQIVDYINYDERYANKTVVDGLTAKSYLYEFGVETGKAGLSVALEEWDKDLLKAYYAESEEDAMRILRTSAGKLEKEGIKDFCEFLKSKEDAGDVIYY